MSFGDNDEIGKESPPANTHVIQRVGRSVEWSVVRIVPGGVVVDRPVVGGCRLAVRAGYDRGRQHEGNRHHCYAGHRRGSKKRARKYVRNRLPSVDDGSATVCQWPDVRRYWRDAREHCNGDCGCVMRRDAARHQL